MSALSKLTWTEFKLFVREPFTVVFVFAFPLIVLLVLAGVFGNTPDEDFGGVSPIDYYVPSYMGVVISSIGLIGVPVHLAAYRERGILRRLRASSVPAGSVFGSQVIVGFTMAALGSLLLVAVASATYDVGAPAEPAAVAVAFVVGAASFLALGVLLATLAPSARAAQAVGLALFFPMWLLSGAGPPPAVMTETMRDISEALPLTHVVTAIREPWLGQGVNTGELGLLAGILAVAATLSIALSRRG